MTRRLAGWMLRVGALAPAAAALAGCTSAPVQIGYETGAYLLTSTGERLYRVHATRIGALYLKPGAQLIYYEVALRPATLNYQGTPPMASVLNHKPGSFRLPPDAEASLQRGLDEALARELTRRGAFRIVPEPTAGALLISPHVVDLRWEVPPPRGGESLYVRRSGVMTLIADLRDARSGALLARLADARAIAPDDVGLDGGFESTGANNRAGVRDVCTRWGWLLRETLETLRRLPPLPDPPPDPGTQPPG